MILYINKSQKEVISIVNMSIRIINGRRVVVMDHPNNWTEDGRKAYIKGRVDENSMKHTSNGPIGGKRPTRVIYSGL